MAVRIAATGVSHWHSLHDSAYLRHVVAMPDAELVGLHDPSAAVVAERAATLGKPPTFTDHRQMLEVVRPDFVIALGRHRDMPGVAHDLLDRGVPFLMEKPMGVDAGEVRGIAEKAEKTGGFAAVPFIQRYHPFVARARALLARDGGAPSLRTRRRASNRGLGAPGALATEARTLRLPDSGRQP